MKFLLTLLIASQAFLLINGRETIFGDQISYGSRFSLIETMTVPGPTNNTIANFTQTFNADGFIWSIRAIDMQGNSQIQVESGGQGHHQAVLRAWNNGINQPVNFRVEIYAGVGMAKASIIFLAVAFFISYLLNREFIEGEVGVYSRLALQDYVTHLGCPSVNQDVNRTFTVNYEISGIWVVDIVDGPSVATVNIVDGGVGHGEVTMRFRSPINGHGLHFRVAIFGW